MARLLKAKYFKHGDFLTAHAGFNPSYTWSSILEGRKVLNTGLIWSIGNGQNINVWRDPWISDGGNPYVISEHGGDQNNLMVRDLLREDYSGWDVDTVQALFSLEEAGRILKLPLRRLQGPDRLVWSFTKNGIYSVKTGYMQIVENDALDEDPSNYTWLWIWKLNVPPKIQVFMWRCMKDMLPVSANLVGRYVDVDPFCKRCGSEVETAEHVLRDCVWASEFWANSPLHLGVLQLGDGNVSVGEWFLKVVSSIQGEYHGLFFTLLWMIWFARNKLYFQNLELGSAVLQVKAQTLISDFEKAQRRMDRGLRRENNCAARWMPPDLGWFKINTDAAVSSSGKVGIGGVARDYRGEVAWCFAENVTLNLLVDDAEALALLRSLEIATAKHMYRVSFEVDSQVLSNAILFPRIDLSLFGTIVLEIRELLRGLADAKVCWVRCSGNSVAHSLASLAYDLVDPLLTEVIPTSCLNVLSADSMA